MTLAVLFRTTLLLGALTGILLGMGWLLGGSAGITFALLMAGVMNFAAYWWSDKIVLAMYRAQPSKNSRLNRIVEQLAKKAGMPKPQVYTMDAQIPNAFATGRDPKHAAVAATTGILDALDDDELEGVFAHELAHVRNRDTLISTMAATVAGAISYLANMAWYASFGDRENRSMALLPLVILAPLAATLVQLAISRGREYGADFTGAMLTKNPLALAGALGKISAAAKSHPLRGNPATSHMWIVNPFSGGLVGLFSTHPPIPARIQRLETLAKELHK